MSRRTTNRNGVWLLMALAAALMTVCGCGRGGGGAETRQPVSQLRASMPDPAFSALAVEVSRAAGDSQTMRAVREAGILAAAVDCGRPPMCFRDEYGVARGFEVDLLRQAASAFGVKLNMIQAPGPAQITGPQSRPAPGADEKLVDYYFSAAGGWLSFRVEGDAGFAGALRLVVMHLYDTGTYQQLHRNWFSESTPIGEMEKTK